MDAFDPTASPRTWEVREPDPDNPTLPMFAITPLVDRILQDWKNPRRRCPYCNHRLYQRRGPIVSRCERCGTLYHVDECHVPRLPVSEQFTLEVTNKPYPFVCHGCRS
ncbi:MAG: hypothetical protein HYU51_15975 [Candidatus Rokubacteria bacterium]|nr:hypothetical protein [Candidatus Rokubacteria bacterium]